MITITMTPEGRRFGRQLYTVTCIGKNSHITLTRMGRQAAVATVSDIVVHCTIHGIDFTVNGEHNGTTDNIR